MIFRLSSDTARVNLTLEQQVLLLRVVAHYDTQAYAESRKPLGEPYGVTPYRLVNDPQRRQRDGTTASALDRKGLVRWDRTAKTATPTLEAIWLGDALRIEARRREAE